ncbi:hypothetical protein ABW20_dc0110235 [Dactylellina cionopaga]|nr:hypothetical protein ABW20_dc0110235 [Dactylellina cionopaga]
MALHAVMELMNMCKNSVEEDAVWRRVQAGYVLAQGLPVTPRQLTTTEWAVLDIFSNKCRPAKAAHQSCKAQIGGREGMKLGDWMDPDIWDKRKYTFLEVLGSSAWVSPRNPEESRVIKEMMWKGKMFGAFTVKEMEVLKNWISQMDMPGRYEWEIEKAKGTYMQFIRQDVSLKKWETPLHHSLVAYDFKMLPEVPTELLIPTFNGSMEPWKLLVASAMPLQHYLSSPAKCSTLRGMTVLKILRTLNGLPDVGNMVAGMDEAANPSGEGVVDTAKQLHHYPQGNQEMSLGAEWVWLRATSLAPEANFWFLVGVQFGLVLLMRNQGTFGIVDSEMLAKLQEKSSTIIQELEQLGFRQYEESRRGFWVLVNSLAQKTRTTVQL